MFKANWIHDYWPSLVDWLDTVFGGNARYQRLSPAVRRLIATDRAALDLRFDGALNIGAMMLAIFLALTLWKDANPVHLTAWIGVYAALIAVKFAYLYLNRKETFCDKTTREIERILLIRWLFAFVHGAIWGSAAVLFFDPASQSTLSNLAICLGIFNGAGVVLSTVSVPLYLALLLPSMLPLQAVLLLHSTDDTIVYILGAPVYVVAMVTIARILHDVVSQYLEMRYSNFELMEEWREKIARLESCDEAKTRFLSVVSHDLRQPVHAIGLMADELHEHVSDAQGRELVTGINSAVDSLRHSFESLLNLTKLEVAAIKPTIVFVSLQKVFDRLDDEFNAMARENGVLLKFMPTRLATFSDPNMLHNIVSNFVSNALYYCPTGRVTVGCRRRADQIDILVYDTGPGIPEDRVAWIFKPFHRLPGDKEDGGGNMGHAGLGLAIADRTARALGHRIGVRSQLGKGSCFQLTVRRAIQKEADKVVHTPPEEAIVADIADMLNGCTIAYLEDDPLVRGQTVALFSRWGCVVRASPNVAHFLSVNESEQLPPDMIVADYRLDSADDINGTTAIAQLRARLGRHIPAVVISGDTTGRAVADTQKMGLKLINKPVKPARLRTILSELRRAAVRSHS